MEFKPEDLEALRSARHTLEETSLAIRISNLIGTPIEKATRMLPDKWSGLLHDATRRAIQAALKVALATLDKSARAQSRDWLHKALVTATGAGSGVFGLPALILELPASTAIMLRSIADIARSQGEDLRTAEARLECVKVFALGGATSGDDAADTGYFAVRAALAREVAEAAKYLVGRGVLDEAAPVLVRFISRVASRFSTAVGQKAAAQAVPIIGAAGGATVNLLFIDHFQDVARAHFTIRRLERIYGAEAIRSEYTRAASSG
jgi:hypothetical protein